ncbi:GNAT family N-acetyltransferase [Sandarakinorhabdus rubra]|uniref:GNAT family N-acetyltransferase n=1 Tax=Sandarakinorhabdus rubra TaxID=2672568 RepID=UPI0013DA261A|nr:GNAT family N-acetyltransferase [Sandarakinorhabdus rubra]
MDIRRLDPETDFGLLPDLAQILADCVAGGASIGFMAGFSHGDAMAWWQARIAAVASGELIVLVALEGGRPLGTVSLVPATMPNQPHRADVAKMMVAPGSQGRGVGMALLRAVEALAHSRARTTLVLDTISGSAAARLYERGGWEKVGEIPAYALMPDGTMAPTTYYTKRLG